MPVGSTSWRSVQVPGFADIGLLTPPSRLYPLAVRQASALPTASSRFRLATDTFAVQLTLPFAGCVGDFHPQVSAPCRAHQKKGDIVKVIHIPFGNEDNEDHNNQGVGQAGAKTHLSQKSREPVHNQVRRPPGYGCDKKHDCYRNVQLSPELEEAAARAQQEVTAEIEAAERELELMRQEGEAEEMAAE